jgi:hypothetical protein
MAEGVPFPRFLIRIPSSAAKRANRGAPPDRGRRSRTVAAGPGSAATAAVPAGAAAGPAAAAAGSARHQANRAAGRNANDCKVSLSDSAGPVKRLITEPGRHPVPLARARNPFCARFPARETAIASRRRRAESVNPRPLSRRNPLSCGLPGKRLPVSKICLFNSDRCWSMVF